MELGVLGPVEAWRDGELVELGSRQHRLIVAVLALEVGRTVPVDRLVELLWPEAMPKSPRSTLQVRVSQLRSALAPDASIEGGADGYRLDLEPASIDAHRFRALLDEARRQPDLDERVRTLRKASSLWRGDALNGAVTDERVRARLCSGLEESRLTAIEDRLEAELAVGRHSQVVDELAGLVSIHPSRERFVAQLMLALHRSGHSQKALETARDHRKWMSEELGLDPGHSVQDLETAIQRDDPALRQPTEQPRPTTRHMVPAQLPPVAGGFTGREQQLLELDLLLPATDDAPHAKRAVITGTAGVGKTSLAVFWAHHAIPHFPDGQLYVDLRGHASGPARTPHDALGTLLQGLGVEPQAIPSAIDDAAAMFRSKLAGKRVLLLLDNARHAEQVRPLLPGSAESLTLITSRERLSGLVAREGAARIPLDALSPDEAVRLLHDLLGAVRSDEEGIAELAQRCAYLPLALRIAAAQLADEPHLAVQDYLAELREHPLVDLAVEGDVSVAAALDVSYERLDADARQLYRALGLFPGYDWRQPDAAALLGRTVREVRPTLRRLVSAHLVEEHEGRRYRFHDLLRDHAARQAELEDSAELRDQALERLLSWYHVNLEEVDHRKQYTSRLPFPPPTLASPLPPTNIMDRVNADTWWRQERSNVVAAIVFCAEHGRAEWACALSWRLRGVLYDRGYIGDHRIVCEAACRAAAELGDDPHLADAHTALGKHHAPRDPRLAIEHYGIAMGHAKRLDNPLLTGKIAFDLGVLWLYSSEPRRAYDALVEVLAQVDAGQPIQPRGYVLANIAAAAAGLGWFAEALGYEEEIVRLSMNSSKERRTLALANYSATLSVLGRVAEARVAAEQALAVAREEGVPFAEGFAHYQQGHIATLLGEWEVALHHADQCTEIGERITAPMLTSCAELVRGACRHGLGEYEAARACWQKAVDITTAASQHEAMAEAYIGLSQTEIELSDYPSARDHAAEAMVISTNNQLYDLVGRSHAAIAAVELADGESRPAVGHAQQALEIARVTGHVRARETAEQILERAQDQSASPRLPG